MSRRRFGSPTMRLLDLGTVPWLRSQSIHHAIARTFTDATPDTLVVVRPDQAYVSLGRHLLGAPVNRRASRRLRLPVVRRQLGGGSVLITPDQTFFVFIVHQRRLPLPDPAAFDWCLGAGVAAYRRLGVDAEVGPGTDITGSGRKLCGSGAATIGHAAVFGGNVIGDFDADAFLEVVRTPSGPFREALSAEMSSQMGSLRLLTGTSPPAQAVASALIEGAQDACDVRLVPGSLADWEADALSATEAWLRRLPPVPRSSAPMCWKVRSGTGVCRMALTKARRCLIVHVRDRAISEFAAERPDDVSLAALLTVALRGRSIDRGTTARELVDCGVPDGCAADVAALLSRFGHGAML